MNVLYETLVGSHLYGTNTPESDLDICGVFVPSKKEILGLGKYPDEVDSSKKISSGPRNEAGDVDCKHYSIKRFLTLACQGQPGALEILFSRPIDARIATYTWVDDMVWLRDNAIISKRGIAPFLGFAQSQAEKMVRRGEKYNQIVTALRCIDAINPSQFVHQMHCWLDSGLIFGKVPFEYVTDSRYPLFRFAGSDYDVGISLRTFKKQLQRKEERYGTRSKAAALEHLDYKSLLHCMRLLAMAEEFIAHGKITLPVPENQRDFLLSIKRREWPLEGHDVFGEVSARIEAIRKSAKISKSLRDEPRMDLVEEFLIQVHEHAIVGGVFTTWPTEVVTK